MALLMSQALMVSGKWQRLFMSKQVATTSLYQGALELQNV